MIAGVGRAHRRRMKDLREKASIIESRMQWAEHTRSEWKARDCRTDLRQRNEEVTEEEEDHSKDGRIV